MESAINEINSARVNPLNMWMHIESSHSKMKRFKVLAFKALCIIKLFKISFVSHSTPVLWKIVTKRKTQSISYQTFISFSISSPVCPLLHFEKFSSHPANICSFNQLLSAKTISERLSLSFDFKTWKYSMHIKRLCIYYVAQM